MAVGSIEEVVRGETRHLSEMAHGGLASIGLPIGIGDEADRRVEGEVGRYGVSAFRIEWKESLKSLKQVEGDKTCGRKDNHRRGVTKPILLFLRVDAR